MRRFSLAGSTEQLDRPLEMLDEERARDLLSAAEELVYVGHREPALVAMGAALEAVIRLRGCPTAGHQASAPALLEALLASDAIRDGHYDLLAAALEDRDLLMHGFVPERSDASSPRRLTAIASILTYLLEDLQP